MVGFAKIYFWPTSRGRFVEQKLVLSLIFRCDQIYNSRETVQPQIMTRVSFQTADVGVGISGMEGMQVTITKLACFVRIGKNVCYIKTS